MCGICLAIFPSTLENKQSIWESLKAAVSTRGPDAQHEVHQLLEGQELFAFGATLNLRGPIVKQPIQGSDKDFLLFNGEIFASLQEVPDHENDGVHLLELLKHSGVRSLSTLQGPFALIYRQNENLYLCRDALGRRSLLIHMPNSTAPFFFVTSVWPQIGDLAIPVEVYPGRLSEMPIARILATQTVITEDLWPKLKLRPFGEAEHDTALQVLSSQLKQATKKRTLDLRSSSERTPSTARVAILFSGGLDCATLALLSDQFVDPTESIDLLNVAFENPRVLKAAQTLSKSKQKGTEDSNMYNVPDRLAGRSTLAELQHLCPNRLWRFVEINISFSETVERKAEILRLMLPQNTVMDYSIGMALFFAARGQGLVRTVDGLEQSYTSTATILISGLGADELFGGYSRHRRAFEQTVGTEDRKWAALTAEMEMDIVRIGTRNLGRDDRCLSHFGKEARYPFLDEEVVHAICDLPTEVKCDPTLPDGEGDKMLLRRLALSLGLTQAATYKKRAMQFGSRSAKRETSKVSGVDTESL